MYELKYIKDAYKIYFGKYLTYLTLKELIKIYCYLGQGREETNLYFMKIIYL